MKKFKVNSKKKIHYKIFYQILVKLFKKHKYKIPIILRILIFHLKIKILNKKEVYHDRILWPNYIKNK